MNIVTLYAALRRRIKVIYFGILGVKFGKGALIGRGVSMPRNYSSISFGNRTYIDDYSAILSYTINGRPGLVQIGSHVYINRFVIIDCTEKVVIEDGSKIGPFVFITDHDFNREDAIPLDVNNLTSAPVHIGKNVLIGANVVILKGVKIGDNASIGAGAVVTKNIPPGAIAKGIPAHPL